MTFTSGQRVRYARQLNNIESGYCKVGDVGTYYAYTSDAPYGYVHEVELEDGTCEQFLDGELEPVEEDDE